MAYDNNMKGTIGSNKHREKDSHPTHSGSCEIDGVQYWISGWLKENRSTGEKFLSLSFKEKDTRVSPPPRASAGGERTDGNFDEDDFPF